MFSSEDDDRLSFEDFLDMLSVFSRAAPVSLKISYAFRLYGEKWSLGPEATFYVIQYHDSHII